MRGLSGAVTALILVVASVVIALIVVGFAFNLFGSFGSAGAVSPVGPAYLYSSPPNSNVKPTGTNYVLLNVTIDNRGPSVNITSATISGQTVSPSNIQVYVVSSSGSGSSGSGSSGSGSSGSGSSASVTSLSSAYIPAGQNQLIIVFNGVKFSTIGSGPINIQLVLANGQTVYITASVTT
jgi:hypothetical protein